jgi:hypothetical protein
MPFPDLSQVTSTLTGLLEANINLHLQPAGPPVTAVPTAPTQLGDVQNHLSLYLYHLSEDSHYRNAAGPGHDPPDVAKAPMGLCLYYIMTAHHTSSVPEVDPLTQQRLLGLALKTFHDVPVITDNTTVDGVNPVLPQALRGRHNSLQVIMRQLSPDEAGTFWAGDDQHIARLSAYYEVRVVFLEPERPRSLPGIVLNLGTYVIQLGAPALGTSASRIPFTLPPSHGGLTQVIVARPARSILDDRPPGTPPPEHRRFDLVGTNLSVGVARTVILRHARWTHADPTLTEIPVDPALNPDWIVTARSDRVSVEFRTALNYNDASGVAQVETLWPGIYTAELRVVLSRENVGGHPKEIVAASNQVSLTLSPRVTGHAVVAPHLRVDFGNEIDLSLLIESYDDVQVALDGVVYAETPDNPPPNPGQWFRAANSVLLRPHAGVNLAPATPEVHTFRLLINGAETAPHFIELP